jgi:hypothetical protein
VLGNTTAVGQWKTAIAGLMDVREDEIMTIELQVALSPTQPEPPPDVSSQTA